FPIYGSRLSLGLARNRLEEAGVLGNTELIAVADGERRRIGPFDVEFIPVTHSVPHGFATAFHTPQGVVLHSGDFKLDLTPVDGRHTDLSRIGAIASDRGIRLLLSDSTNAEEPGYTASESAVGVALRGLFEEHRDKRIITACAIPGNEWAVAKVIDGLYRLGAEVVHSDQAEIHASGHGKQAELQTMLAVAKPEAFIPVHGEFRHLTHHARLAAGMGVDESKVLQCEDGDVVTLSDGGIAKTGAVA